MSALRTIGDWLRRTDVVARVGAAAARPPSRGRRSLGLGARRVGRHVLRHPRAERPALDDRLRALAAVGVGERPLRGVHAAGRMDRPRTALLGRAGALRPRDRARGAGRAGRGLPQARRDRVVAHAPGARPRGRRGHHGRPLAVGPARVVGARRRGQHRGARARHRRLRAADDRRRLRARRAGPHARVHRARDAPPAAHRAGAAGAGGRSRRSPGVPAGASDPAVRKRVARNVCVSRARRVRRLRARGARTARRSTRRPIRSSDYPARPEWFLLPMFQLRKFFHGAMEFWGTSLVPAAAAGYLVLLPWIDRPGRPRTRRASSRRSSRIFGGAVVLSLVAAQPRRARHALPEGARRRPTCRRPPAGELAMNGVPPAGRARDGADRSGAPRTRALRQALRELPRPRRLGDPEKATATKLDGWGTPAWIEAMIHDPDAPEFFGRGPYKGQMPSVDMRPKDKPAGRTVDADGEDGGREDARSRCFWPSHGDEPGDAPRRDRSGRPRARREDRQRALHDVPPLQGRRRRRGIGGRRPSSPGTDRSRGRARRSPTRRRRRRTATRRSIPSMKKHMPRFDNDLSAADVELVARWTRAHARAALFAAAR